MEIRSRAAGVPLGAGARRDCRTDERSCGDEGRAVSQPRRRTA